MSDTDSAPDECSYCGGTGEIIKTVHGRQGLVQCPDCDGTGTTGEGDR